VLHVALLPRFEHPRLPGRSIVYRAPIRHFCAAGLLRPPINPRHRICSVSATPGLIHAEWVRVSIKCSGIGHQDSKRKAPQLMRSCFDGLPHCLPGSAGWKTARNIRGALRALAFNFFSWRLLLSLPVLKETQTSGATPSLAAIDSSRLSLATTNASHYRRCPSARDYTTPARPPRRDLHASLS
jgi:hypothetical protein